MHQVLPAVGSREASSTSALFCLCSGESSRNYGQMSTGLSQKMADDSNRSTGGNFTYGSSWNRNQCFLGKGSKLRFICIVSAINSTELLTLNMERMAVLVPSMFIHLYLCVQFYRMLILVPSILKLKSIPRILCICFFIDSNNKSKCFQIFPAVGSHELHNRTVLQLQILLKKDSPAIKNETVILLKKESPPGTLKTRKCFGLSPFLWRDILEIENFDPFPRERCVGGFGGWEKS